MPSLALTENTDTRPSIAWRFQSPIIVWCTTCFVASYDAVSSPHNASITTLALNSAEYRFRLPVVRSVLYRRTKLNRLSDKPGPPHIAAVGCATHRTDAFRAEIERVASQYGVPS